MRPELAERASQFMLLERAVEDEYRPHMLAELQRRVEAVAETTQAVAPPCPRCGRAMRRQDTRSVSWLARFGRLQAPVTRYRCAFCRVQCRPLLEALGVEPGRISGSLGRLLALLAVVAPYPLAARLAALLLGVTVSPMGVWRVAQRLGQAAAHYSESLSEYHADSRSEDIANPNAPQTVVLSVDGCALGMQVRPRRRRPGTAKRRLRCRRFRRAGSARSRPGFCSCRKNASRSRRDAARWCGAFWSVVWETPMRSSTGSTRSCGNCTGWVKTPSW
jgi:hypothetical protein